MVQNARTKACLRYLEMLFKTPPVIVPNRIQVGSGPGCDLLSCYFYKYIRAPCVFQARLPPKLPQF